MTVNDYPEFVEGQTLTAPELNQLTTNLRYRDTLVARMVGFGINAGLAGSVSGSTLTIDPGFAIDQNGEPLFLDTPFTATFPVTPATTAYPFIDASAEGYSAVLEVHEGDPHAPLCSETDCAGHAKVHLPKVQVTIVKGKITGAWLKFAADELLTQTPLEVTLTSDTPSSGKKLAQAIAKRLRNGTGPDVVPEASIAVLDSFSIESGDIPGAKGYKAGWINSVLFAALDLLRARALFGLDALHSANPAGVVLGWIHYESSAWKFDCSFRHAWEPPRGFSEAFLGGTCSHPFKLYEDQLVGLLNGYSPPVPPPASGGGGKPPVVVKCPKGMEIVKGKCIYVITPPKKVNPDWNKHWIIKDPLAPVWNPQYRYTDYLENIYEQPGLNYYHDGILGIAATLGYPADVAVATVKDVVTEGGDIPTVLAMSASEATKLTGYLPSSGASPSDTIVLTTDAANVVIATGRIPAVTSAKQAGTLVPQAQAAVVEVHQVVADAQAMQAEITATIAGYDAQLSDLSGSLDGIKAQMLTLQVGAQSPGVLEHRVSTLEAQTNRMIELSDRVSMLEGKIAVTKVSTGDPRTIFETAPILAEFAESTIEALKTVSQPGNRNFTRYVADAERVQGEFELAAASGNLEAAQTATLEMLDSLRTAVGAAGADRAAKSKLDAQFRAVKEFYG